MANPLHKALSLETYFANLTERGEVKPVEVTETFWSEGLFKLDPGRLVSRITHETDWSNWEMHPNGDELIIGLSGRITFLLEREGHTERVELEPGEFLVVPRTIWHTADVMEPGAALYITAGEGTQHRAR